MPQTRFGPQPAVTRGYARSVRSTNARQYRAERNARQYRAEPGARKNRAEPNAREYRAGSVVRYRDPVARKNEVRVPDPVRLGNLRIQPGVAVVRGGEVPQGVAPLDQV